ncbi:unnamed protein product, partial [Soboliphyme baturini]|uniref:Transposase n=1 Tax=Soboliphyme baturini TaxID=241478 RepID=A0A183J3E7_9BILA
RLLKNFYCIGRTFSASNRKYVLALVIKRRGNIIILVGIVERRISSAKMLWLIGFTEELFSLIFKQPVKMELQTIENKEEIVYKYI